MLIASKEVYRHLHLFHEFKDTIVVTDSQFFIIYWNPAAIRLFGIEEAKALGKPLQEVLITKGSAKVFEKAQEDFQRTNVWRGEIRSADQQGREIWLDWLLQPLRLPEVDFFGTISIIKDVSEYKSTENKLRESEEKYRALVDAASDCLCVVESGRVRFANPRLVELLDYPLEEIVGRELERFFAADEWDRVKEYYRRYSGGERNMPIVESKVKRRDGTQVEVDFHASRIPFEDRPAVLVIIRDISDRKRTEEMIRSSEERYRLLVELITEGVGIVDLEDNFLFVNPAAERIFDSRLTGRNFFEFVDQENAEILHAQTRRRVAGHSDVYHLRIVRPNGSRAYIIVSARPLTDLNGNTSAILAVFLDVTDRKLFEDTSSRSEELFRLAFHTSPDSMNINRLVDGLYVDVNQGFTDLTGYTREDVIGRSSIEINIWADSADREKLIQRLRQDGFVRDFEANFRLKDGRVAPGLMSARLLDIRGEPHILSIVHDISDRKNAEMELARKTTHLQTLLQAIPDVVYFKDKQGRNMLVNRAFERMVGRTSEELIGKTDAELFSPELAEYCRQSDETVYQKKRPLRFEEENPLPEGGIQYFESIKSPILDEAGEPIGMVGVSRDITDRKKAEHALAESEKTLRAIFSSSPIGIGVVRNRILDWYNDAMAAMLGRDKQEMIGQSARVLYPSDEEYARVGEIAYHLDNPLGYCETETKWVRKDGVVFDAWVRLASIGKSADKAVIATVIDISENKRSEQEKRKLEEQLRQSQKMEAIGRLAGGVAHDFNNLLTAIQGYAEILSLALPAADPLFQDTQEIKYAADRAAALTQQLLAFSRKQLIAPKIIDLNDVLSRAQRMLGRIIGEDIQLQFNPAPDLWAVMADPHQIDQILVNLSVNARDAMPSGGILSIKTANCRLDETFCADHPEIVPGGYVLLSISDTGIGMDSALLKNIFEPFFTTKDKDKGTGLGLAMVYGIVQQNRGVIGVYSEPGIGTTFNIYLPRTVENAVGHEEEHSPALATGRETILVVEDEDTVRRLAEKILRKLGYRVLAAATLAEAQEHCLAVGRKIDLLLTDVIMPVLNGKELHDRLREIIPDLKVLYMSGYTEDIIAHQGAIKEGTHFIQKPFSIETLSLKIRQALEN